MLIGESSINVPFPIAMLNWLVVSISLKKTIYKHMSSSVGMIIFSQNEWKVIKAMFQTIPNHQPVNYHRIVGWNNPPPSFTCGSSPQMVVPGSIAAPCHLKNGSTSFSRWRNLRYAQKCAEKSQRTELHWNYVFTLWWTNIAIENGHL